MSTIAAITPAPPSPTPAPVKAPSQDFATALEGAPRPQAPARGWLAPLQDLEADRTRLDGLLHSALTGRRFSPGELLALQCGIHRLNTELELAAKVVEQSHAAVRRALSTEV